MANFIQIFIIYYEFIINNLLSQKKKTIGNIKIYLYKDDNITLYMHLKLYKYGYNMF